MNEPKKIIEEEIIRDEVRKILVSSMKDKNKFFDFFNSALGIFILTTVFVTFGSWAYSQFAAHRESRANEDKILYQLSNEISYRLDLIKEMNGPGMLESEYFNLLSANFGFDGKRDLMSYYLFKSIYKEYEHRTLHSLISEYKYVSKKPAEELLEIVKEFPYFERSMSYTVVDSIRINNQRFYKMPKKDSILFEERIKSKIKSWLQDSFR